MVKDDAGFFDELKDLMTFYPTLEETASWFSCSPDTIERAIKKESGLTFAEFRHRFSGKTRLMLKRKAISMALEGDNEKMLLYCLRTMTDLDDRSKPAENNEPVVIKLAYEDSRL